MNHKGMRRDKFDTPKRNPDADRERIERDTAEFIASGGVVRKIDSGLSSTPYGSTTNMSGSTRKAVEGRRL